MKSIYPEIVTGAALLGLLSACHGYVVTQDFSGVLLKGGAPMAGAQVLVSHTRGDGVHYCVHPEVVAVTSEHGSFHVAARSQARGIASWLNPPGTVQQMTSYCFQALGKQKLGALVLAPTDREVKYSAVCEWDSSSVAFKQDALMDPAQWGICKRGAAMK